MNKCGYSRTAGLSYARTHARRLRSYASKPYGSYHRTRYGGRRSWRTYTNARALRSSRHSKRCIMLGRVSS